MNLIHFEHPSSRVADVFCNHQCPEDWGRGGSVFVYRVGQNQITVSTGEIRGSVYGAGSDREPVAGTTVIRHTSVGTPLDRNQTYWKVTTDADGNFEFPRVWERQKLLVAAKDGWYPHASRSKTNLTLVPIPKETIALRDVYIPVDGKSGFSLARRTVVPKSEADFMIELIPGEFNWFHRIELRGLGAAGFAKIGSDEVGLGGAGEWTVVHSAFLRATKAPLEGFSTIADPGETGAGWFIRSRDGKHYGKLRCRGGTGENGELAVRFYLAFQANGSRDLATAFDAEEFLAQFWFSDLALRNLDHDN